MFVDLDDGKVSLSTHPAGSTERRLALGMGLFSFVVFAALIPLARIQLAQIDTFIPTYESALFLSDLFTAGLLIREFREQGIRALLVLLAAYLFTALIVVIHALSFPGLFSPTGLLGAGPQTTAWLYMIWHGGFPLFLIAFAFLKEDRSNLVKSRDAAIVATIGLVAVAVGVFAALTTLGQDLLPSIMDGNKYTPIMIFTVGATWLLSVIALLVLWHRRNGSVLDTWLMVVMCAWICDIGLSAVFNAGRYDLGFYAGRLYGLMAGGFVLVVLLEPRFSRRRY